MKLLYESGEKTKGHNHKINRLSLQFFAIKVFSLCFYFSSVTYPNKILRKAKLLIQDEKDIKHINPYI